MSRAYRTRQKAKRQQARAAAAVARKPKRRGRRTPSRRLVAFMPVAVIVAIFAAIGLLVSISGANRESARERVTTLLADIPQNGTTLGSPRAPVTISIFADIECPTVRRFVVSYLPSILATWVRTGAAKLEYRSLQTDTTNEHTFFDQEIAALAAGRQDKMWNYLLLFVHEQGQKHTNYATEQFFTGIASQVPELKQAQWRRDREDPLLSRQVALGVQAAHAKGFRFTPSFSLGFTSGNVDRRLDRDSIREKVEASLRSEIDSLGEEASREASRDVPTLGVFGSSVRGN